MVALGFGDAVVVAEAASTTGGLPGAPGVTVLDVETLFGVDPDCVWQVWFTPLSRHSLVKKVASGRLLAATSDAAIHDALTTISAPVKNLGWNL